MTVDGAVDVFVNLTPGARVHCHTDFGPPVLVIADAGLQIHISPAGPAITNADIASAGELVAAIAEYHASVQRLADAASET